MICPGCCPWNLPLQQRAVHTVDAGTIPMRFEHWLVYRLHVQQHQKGNWAGEIDALQQLLRTNPSMTLVAQ